MLLLGKAVTCGFLPFGPGTFPCREIKSIYSPCWVYLFVLGISFPVPGLMCTSLFCVCHMATGQRQCYICSWRGGNRFFCLQHKMGACRPSPCVGCGASPADHGGRHSLLKLILLCLFSPWVKHCYIQCLCESCLSWLSQHL